MVAVLLDQDHRQQAGPAKPRAITWKGAGGWVIFSHARQVNFSRTCSVTNHCRGTTSSVSVTSSPIFESDALTYMADLDRGSSRDRGLGIGGYCT